MFTNHWIVQQLAKHQKPVVPSIIPIRQLNRLQAGMNHQENGKMGEHRYWQHMVHAAGSVSRCNFL
jgi:hypothetical protein